MRRDPDVIRVYSHSLLQAVKSTGQLKQYVADAVTLREWYLKQPRLRAFMEGPHIREQDKMGLVEKVFGGGRVLPVMFNFLRVLVNKKRILMLPDILQEFRIIGEEEMGHVVGKVVTAVQLDPTKARLLTQKLESVTGLSFTFDYRVDPDVLGGVFVQYKDVIIDGTLRGRLREIRARLEAVVQ